MQPQLSAQQKREVFIGVPNENLPRNQIKQRAGLGCDKD